MDGVEVKNSQPSGKAGINTTNEPLLSIILVSFNVKNFLEQALRSIQKATGQLSCEVIVVDNASQDGSVELVRSKFPEVQLIANDTNRGFARANNQAFRIARGKFIALVNPDVLVQEDTFQTLLDFLRSHPEAGMVGCKILNPDGTLQLACRRSIPTPWVAFTKLIGLSYLFPKSKIFGRYNLTYLDADAITEVEAVSGSFMIVRRKVVEDVGYLDDAFFLYGEDLDWCYRIRKKGWKIYYVPTTKIIHYKGASSQKGGFDSLLLFYQAMLLFVRKHFRGRYLFFTQWFLVAGIAIRGFFSLLRRLLQRWAYPLVDLAALNVSLLIALMLRFGTLKYFNDYLVVDILYSSIWLMCLYFFDLYEHQPFSVSRAATAVTMGWMINSCLTFFVNQIAFSRIVVFIAGIMALSLIPGWRLGLRLLAQSGKFRFLNLIRSSLFRRRTLIVGSPHKVAGLVRRLRERVDAGYEVVGVVLSPEVEALADYPTIPVYKPQQNLSWLIQNERIKEVIFSADEFNYERILELVADCKGLNVDFKMAAGDLEVIIGKSAIDYVDDIPLVDIDYRLSHAPYRLLKRGFDLVIASLVTVFSFPLVAYLWFIRGYHLKQWAIISEKGIPIDLRVLSKSTTKSVHHWYEKIPLFWAVISGKLTLVGGEMIPAEKSGQCRTLYLKPGITGLVHLHGSDKLLDSEKDKYELYYMKNYSPFFDLEILLKTIVKG
ncbi:MAG TPA: glycosyltransferase [Bacteroidetes bacterium]|nr:glycosyltransferase [Bacteroidota bacterium]